MLQEKKPFWKKWWFWILAIAIIATIGREDETKKTTSSSIDQKIDTVETQKPAEQKQDSTIKKANEVETTQITKSGGLGDSIKVFEKNYGPNSGDEMLARFKDDYILPMFLNGKASNVRLEFESTNEKRRTREEALSLAKDIIPTDSVKIKEWQVEPGKDVIQYESNSLAKVFDKDSFGSAKQGTLIVILKSDDKGVFTVVVGKGNNP